MKTYICHKWHNWRAYRPDSTVINSAEFHSTQLIIKLAGQTCESTFVSAVQDIYLYYKEYTKPLGQLGEPSIELLVKQLNWEPTYTKNCRTDG